MPYRKIVAVHFLLLLLNIGGIAANDPCTTPFSTLNIKTDGGVGANTTSGETITFDCANGYIPSGVATCTNKVWDTPICRDAVQGNYYIKVTNNEKCIDVAVNRKTVAIDIICELAALNVETQLATPVMEQISGTSVNVNALYTLDEKERPSKCYLNPDRSEGDRYLYILFNTNTETEAKCSTTYPCICEKGCEKGEYQDEEGQITCKECQPGYYNNELGQPVCKKCPLGTWNSKYKQISLIDGCFLCAKGQYGNTAGLIECTDCAVGQYAKDAKQTECSRCKSGTYNDEVASDSAQKCKKCVEGNYQSELGKTSCVACRKGKFQNQAGKSKCNDCLAGRYNTDEGGINDDVQVNDGTKGCVKCDAGMYSIQVGQETSTCLNCPIGTAVNSKGSDKIDLCAKCAEGKFSNKVGQALCEACVAGTYASGTGMAECTVCKAGQFSKDIGRENECTDCPLGYFTTKTSAIECDACNIGSYGIAAGQSNVGTACTDCPSGWRGNSDVVATTDVKTTDGQTVTDSPCAQCEFGKYSSTPGKKECLDVSEPCQPGYISTTIGNNQDDPKCEICAYGQYSDEEGASKCSMCPQCKKGEYGTTLPGSADCTPCQNCPPGSYTDDFGQQGCKKCPSGEASVGRIECQPWLKYCNALDSGCLQLYGNKCARKLCNEVNEIMPDPSIILSLKYLQNLSDSTCQEESVTFDLSQIGCQKCSLGGKCQFGWCTTPNHDEMNRCSVCKAGYYTSDCIECPPLAVAYISDALILGLGMYLLIALLYMVLLPSKTGPENAAGASARKGVKAVGLAGVLINQLQVATSILSNISWSPRIPGVIVAILKFVTYLSSFNISLLLATPECGGVLDARQRWQTSMLIPLAVALFCLLWGLTAQCWLRVRGKKSAAVRTNRIILQASVYLLLLGLYQSTLRTSMYVLFSFCWFHAISRTVVFIMLSSVFLVVILYKTFY